MTEFKLHKPHSSSLKDDPPLCLYCETFHPSSKDRFPKRHTENIAGDPVNCPGAVHRELQLHEAIPGVSGPEVMVIVACDTCKETKTWKFFDYVRDGKTFELMSPQELVGIVFGHLHVINSDAMLLVNYHGDKNLHTKKQGKKIAIHRAICHAAMQALSDVVHSERLWKVVDLTYTIADDGCSVFLGTIKLGTLSPTRVREIERLIKIIDGERPMRLSGEGTETLLHDPLGIRPCPPARLHQGERIGANFIMSKVFITPSNQEFLEVLREDAEEHLTNWTISRHAQPGDTVLLYICAPTMAIVAVGTVATKPEQVTDPQSEWFKSWFADVHSLLMLQRELTRGDIMRLFPAWRYWTRPRNSIQVPNEFEPRLMTVINENLRAQ